MGREGSGEAVGETGRGGLSWSSGLWSRSGSSVWFCARPPPLGLPIPLPPTPPRHQPLHRAVLALGAQGIPEGLKAAAGALPQGEGAYVLVKDRNNE